MSDQAIKAWLVLGILFVTLLVWLGGAHLLARGIARAITIRDQMERRR